MFEKIICRILGINVIENNKGVHISLEKMAKKHPGLTKQVMSNLASELTKKGANVHLISDKEEY